MRFSTASTSDYSARAYHPILEAFRAHQGIDYGAPAGTPVYSTITGTISFAGTQGGYGKLVAVESSSITKVSTYYAHLQEIPGHIITGLPVKAGDLIGYVGATGLATGPHLHYEWRVGDSRLPPPAKTRTEILMAYQRIRIAGENESISTLRKLTIQK